MGIGVVLLVWLIVWLGLACLLSSVLGPFTLRLVRHASRRSRTRAVSAVVVLPPVSMIAGVIGFVGYGIWCETSRGVDAGVGDLHVPLGSGYQLVMIDTRGEAYVDSPVGDQFGVGSRGLGFDDKTIYFGGAHDTFQLIEKASARSSIGLSEAELADRLRSLGSPAASLRCPASVYSNLRWGKQDLLVVPLILGLPALLSVGVAAYIWRVWRGTQESNRANRGTKRRPWIPSRSPAHGSWEDRLDRPV